MIISNKQIINFTLIRLVNRMCMLQFVSDPRGVTVTYPLLHVGGSASVVRVTRGLSSR